MASVGLSRSLLTRINACTCSTVFQTLAYVKNFPTEKCNRLLRGTDISKPLLENFLPKHSAYISTSAKLYAAPDSGGSDTGSKEHIKGLVNHNKVVVFMKGVPEEPRCGFSNAVIQILRMHGVDYDSHNVLEDDHLRSGVKEYSDWPTIPQVYFNGEFIGGCDILLQMHQNGDLIDELKSVGIRSALLDKKE